MRADGSVFPYSADRHMCTSCFRILPPYSSHRDSLIVWSFASHHCQQQARAFLPCRSWDWGPVSLLSRHSLTHSIHSHCWTKGSRKDESVTCCHTLGPGAPCSSASHQQLSQESKGCPQGMKASKGILCQPFPWEHRDRRKTRAKTACGFLNPSGTGCAVTLPSSSVGQHLCVDVSLSCTSC